MSIEDGFDSIDFGAITDAEASPSKVAVDAHYALGIASTTKLGSAKNCD